MLKQSAQNVWLGSTQIIELGLISCDTSFTITNVPNSFFFSGKHFSGEISDEVYLIWLFSFS